MSMEVTNQEDIERIAKATAVQLAIRTFSDKLSYDINEEASAETHYLSLAREAERLGLIDIYRELLAIANDEGRHHRILKEIQSKLP